MFCFVTAKAFYSYSTCLKTHTKHLLENPYIAVTDVPVVIISELWPRLNPLTQILSTGTRRSLVI